MSLPAGGPHFRGELLPPVGIEEWVPFSEGEGTWQMAGAELPDWAAQALPEPQPAARTPRKRRRAKGWMAFIMS